MFLGQVILLPIFLVQFLPFLSFLLCSDILCWRIITFIVFGEFELWRRDTLCGGEFDVLLGC
jgi:hypothetical protein